MKIDNLIINASGQDILNTLKSDLLNKGIIRFAVWKPNGDNIQTNCPFHKGGQERKPSFGINIKDGRCHCFTCGWSGDISDMIGEVFLRDSDYGKKWLIKHFNSTEVETRQKILELPITRGDWINKDAIKHTSEQVELKEYRWIHPYMYERGLTDEIIEKFDIGFDKSTNCITFPIYDTNNNLMFIARRNVKTKFYKYPQNVEKPVYALNMVTDREVYVVESFFNALTIWKHGKQAIAMIGTGTREQYEILKKSNIRSYILAFDPDDAGRKATKRFRDAMSKYASIKEVAYVEEGKDVNDLDDKFFELKIIL